ncbi:MAG TPA: AAA family ATPase [Mucilaginibacter sp.]
MHINIFGASCSGVTTLGKNLAQRLGYPYFDGDDYFWLKTEVPFTERRPSAERNELINQHLSEHQNWILGGSVINWQQSWQFDLSVFLYIPRHIRVQRLMAREQERYGNIIHTDPARNKIYNEFIDWASGYDDNTTQGRTLSAHQNWIKTRKEPVLIIDGDRTVEERIDLILSKM